jgi:hypothetical protein
VPICQSEEPYWLCERHLGAKTFGPKVILVVDDHGQTYDELAKRVPPRLYLLMY